MLLLGRIVFVIGLIVTIIGVVGGFGFMYADVHNWAKFCFMLSPVGFLLLFVGLSTTVLVEPRDSDK
ncbi:MAG: hypothetical protein CR991_10085 [Proteobacteria bacterium]|nr:MAG: hypothetical protein CR991_10085 [Pseudomonadota bacterium]